MRKILKSLLVLALVAGSVYGIAQSGAWFTDEENIPGNNIHAGTIDITAGLVNGAETFTIADMKPSTVHYMQMEIKNVGENEADVWKRLVIDRENYSDGLTPESEPAGSDNNIGGVIRYDMQIDGDVLISESDGFVLDDNPIPEHLLGVPINGFWMYLGRLLPQEIMAVDQSYHMDGTTGNWAQGDEMTFDVELFAQQIVGGAPSPDGELAGLTRCQNGDSLEMYNIGTGEDTSHNLLGWSNAWTEAWGGGYGGRDDGSFRLLTGPGDSCDAGYESAEFTMHAGTDYGVQLTLNHLDGSQDDSFDLYVKIAGIWTKFGHYQALLGGENWVTTTFNLPQPVTGNVEFKLVATQPNDSWCATWGQVAFSWAELLHSTCPTPTPD